MDIDRLRALDARGFRTLNALAHARNPRQPGTLATPHAFICTGGRTYWVKRRSQNGLVSELVAARIGSTLKVSPAAEIVDVPEAALPEDGSASHLLGRGVGIEGHEGFNPKEINEFLQEGGTFSADVVRAADRAAVVVFQSWIGAAGDSQVLVNPTTGGVLSIDHGDSLPETPGAVQLVVTTIPGVEQSLGSARSDGALDVVGRIEALDDDDILTAFAGVPDGAEWNSAADRRLRMAESLSRRRANLREVISGWLQQS